MQLKAVFEIGASKIIAPNCLQEMQTSDFGLYAEKENKHSLLLKKILLAMKLTTFFLIASMLSASAKVSSQVITLSEKSVTLDKVFTAIEKQTGYVVFCDYQYMKDVKPITLNVKREPLTIFLNRVLKGNDLDFTIEDKTIIVSKEKRKILNNDNNKMIAPLETHYLKGIVVNENGIPMVGVVVTIKGSNKSVLTDANGAFDIKSSTAAALLIFSNIGYEIKEVKIEENKPQTIRLVPKVENLASLVVVGYGSVRKEDLTGSIATVNVDNQSKTPVVGTAQLLEGRASGVQVIQNQSQPGGTVFSVRIRGTNSISSSSEPLYVVDGYAGADISTLDPNDIASMQILKDASAVAIYGSRGANGVIIITTKRGNSGQGVTLDAYTGLQKVSKKYDMMNAEQFAKYLNDVQQELNTIKGTSKPLPYTQDQINALGVGTDWQNAIFRTAPISNISVGLFGGHNESRYFLGVNYFTQKGIILGSDYKRGAIRFNVDQNVGKKIKITLSSQAAYGYQNAPSVNTSGGTVPSILWDAVRFNPAIPVRDSSGNYSYQNSPAPFVNPSGNPVAFGNESKDANYHLNVFANSSVAYKIIPSLTLKSTFGINYENGGNKRFIPSYLYIGAITGGAASQSSSQNYNWLNENTITFDKELGQIHHITAVIGYSNQHWYDKGFNSNVTNLSTDNEGADNLGIGTPAGTSSSFTENVLSSYFGRVNYRLLEKYLFTFTMRADGSSRFGENNKWGYFPSGAFAWRVSQENFLKNVKAISDLKLRLSYGATGNQEIGSYHSLSQYSSNNYSYGAVPSVVVGIYPSNIPNPNLKWESTASSDIGLDLGLFKNILSITADYYYKKTTNLLLNESIPQSSGYSSILKNVGSVENKGFELGITSTNINTKSVQWNTTFNFSTNKNKVLSLGTNKQIYAGDLSGSLFPSANFKSGILKVGQPIGSFYGYVFDGIWQSQAQITKSGTKQNVRPGDPIYEDLNGDSILNGSDRKIIGHALPKFTYGFTSDLTWRRFDLNVFLQGVYGNNILNENLYDIQNGSTSPNKLAYIATKSWMGEGTSNTYPAVSSTLRRSTGVTSDVIEDGSFLRVKTITLSYNLPLPKSAFKSATIYATVQNAFTFTKYSGYDPEVNSFPTSNELSLGTDYNAYPNYRSYLIGIKFNF